MTQRTARIVISILLASYTLIHVTGRIVPDLDQLMSSSDGRAFVDFDCYSEAARRAARGESIYVGTNQHLECVYSDLPPYIYPPAVVLMLRPFAGLDACDLDRAWLLFNILILVALIPMLSWLMLRSRAPLELCLSAFVLVAPMATLKNLTLGQVNLLILILAATAWYLAGAGHGRWAIAVSAWAACTHAVSPGR